MFLRSLPIRHRLWLILALFLLMLVVQGVFQLQQLYGDLHRGKAEKTQHLVESALGILQQYHRLETQGVMDRAKAQEEAQKLLAQLRYGENDYFWVNDLHPRMIIGCRGCGDADVDAHIDATVDLFLRAYAPAGAAPGRQPAR